jgi:hypothetical protein
LDKQNLFKAQVNFHYIPAAFENSLRFKAGQKEPKNNHLASVQSKILELSVEKKMHRGNKTRQAVRIRNTQHKVLWTL